MSDAPQIPPVPNPPATPRPAASVVLLRTPAPRQAGGFEVFMVRRHGRSAFMGGATVFPGGAVDPRDAVLPAGRFLGPSPEEAAARLGDVPAVEALAHYVAAARELFEEAGVLLSDAPPALSPTSRAQWRERMRRGEVSLFEFAESADVRIDVRGLGYWDHWVTPAVERRRFDARFFVAALPAGAVAQHDAVETTAGGWESPQRWLELHEAGRVTLPPPQLAILDDLARHDSVDAVLGEASRRGPIAATEPYPLVEDGTLYLLLPGDEGWPEEARRGAGRRRFALHSGRWHLVR